MGVSSVRLKRCDLVTLSGRMDSSAVPQVEEVLKDITDAGRFHLVLDMGGVDFASSDFLRMLIRYLKLCRRWNRGDLRLAALSPQVADMLKLTGAMPFFKTFDNAALAVGSF
ncbi:MAG: STAS domain-containing protein [Anaerolineae bacterium]|nr:STAS domain-containing protein [Anaerolineae bacterium]